MSTSYTRTYAVGAAVNGHGHEGRIMRHIAPAGGRARVQISTADAADILAAAGVAVDVEAGPTVGQNVSVCVHGPCEVFVGAGWAAATRPHFVSDANGAAVPAADNQAALGVLLWDGPTRPADGTRAQAIISPSNQGA